MSRARLPAIRLAELAEVSRAVAATPGRLAKLERLALALGRMETDKRPEQADTIDAVRRYAAG